MARMIPERSVQQWRLLRPFLPPALRQWIEAAARAMCAARLPYPLAMQQLDRVIGRSGPSSPADSRPDDAAILRNCVILEMVSAHATASAEPAAPPPCCPMPAPIRISPEVQKYVRSAKGRMLAELPSVKNKAWLPANFRFP